MNNIIKKGFTLIELLVVIGILAVLMAGVVALIDPADKTKQANDSRIQALVAEYATSSEAYAAQHDGFYPVSVAILVSAGELKSAGAVPVGYAAPSYTPLPAGCTSGTTCTSVTVCGTLQAKKYVSTSTQFWKYETTSGKTCAVLSCATACP